MNGSRKRGKKPDMGKACIRFKKLDDVPLEVIGATIRRITAKKYIARYTESLAAMGRRPAGKKPSTSKQGTKKSAANHKPRAKSAARAGDRTPRR